MGNGQQAAQTGTLIERLGKRLTRLEGVRLSQSDAELRLAIEELKEDIEILRVMAPHIYSAPQR